VELRPKKERMVTCAPLIFLAKKKGEMNMDSKCARCGRALKDPVSIERGIGPVCYEKSGGGVFDADLNVDEKEWQRREELLKHGGEIYLGVNWDYPDPGNLIRGYTMRVSLRYRDGAFEAYGRMYKAGQGYKEVIFERSADIKTAYKAAILAGPLSTAQAHRTRMSCLTQARA